MAAKVDMVTVFVFDDGSARLAVPVGLARRATPLPNLVTHDIVCGFSVGGELKHAGMGGTYAYPGDEVRDPVRRMMLHVGASHASNVQYFQHRRAMYMRRHNEIHAA